MRADAECDDRVRGRRLVVGQPPQDAGIVADAGEADRRPAHHASATARTRLRRPRAHAPRHREPDRERPQEELEDDRSPDGSRRAGTAVAPAPAGCDREQQQRLDRAEVDRAPCEEEDERKGVAAPITQLEQPQCEATMASDSSCPHECRPPCRRAAATARRARPQRRIRERLVALVRVRRGGVQHLPGRVQEDAQVVRRAGAVDEYPNLSK